MRSGLNRAMWGILALSASVGIAHAQEPITIVDGGGAWQEASRNALWQPVSASTGIPFREDSWQSIADLRLQVQSGRPTWDVISFPMGECVAAAKEGLFEPLDYGVIPNASILPPDLRTTYYTAGTVWASFVMTWSNDAFGERQPETWADYFDVEGFPGVRGGYNSPRFMIEAALLADGVPSDQIYPMDLDRAFAKLEALKPHIGVWYTAFGQAVDLVNRGEVDFIPMLDGRITDAIKNGADWSFTFNEGIINGACSAVLKGAPNREAAMLFVNGLIDPKLQANLVNYFSYGPMHPGVFDTGLISEERAKTLNSHPENLSRQLKLDPGWWGDNRIEAQARWDAMMR